MTELIYTILLIALTLSLILYNQQLLESVDIQDSPFIDIWAEKLNRLSYTIPFVWFIDEKEKSKRAKDIKQKLVDANLTHKFNYRSFSTLKVLILIFAILFFGLINAILNNSDIILKLLFNIKEASNNVGNNADSINKLKIITLMLLSLLSLSPSVYLKRRAKLYKYYYLKEIPIVQMFIILMLRSKKTVTDVLFALSKINTRYKGIFETGYRIYLRDKNEGLDYIESSFGNSKFKETISVLRDLSIYSREESISLLESNMQQLIEISNTLKRRSDLSKSVYSQSTLALPFISVILLCFIPLVMFGLQIFQNAGIVF
jgi:hypothetical protein